MAPARQNTTSTNPTNTPVHKEEATGEVNEVVAWLHKIGRGEYASRFLSNGYDSLKVVALLDEADLDMMVI